MRLFHDYNSLNWNSNEKYCVSLTVKFKWLAKVCLKTAIYTLGWQPWSPKKSQVGKKLIFKRGFLTTSLGWCIISYRWWFWKELFFLYYLQIKSYGDAKNREERNQQCTKQQQQQQKGWLKRKNKLSKTNILGENINCLN